MIKISFEIPGAWEASYFTNKDGKICRNYFDTSDQKCNQTLEVGEQFVNWATSVASKPPMDRNKYFFLWKKMSPDQRLEYHIHDLVKALGGSNAKYEIN
jgi:hypothetical protein